MDTALEEMLHEAHRVHVHHDQQRLQISDLHFDKFPTPATFACWKIKVQDRGMYLFTISYRNLCIGSKKWRWLIQWMSLMSSSSIRGIQMPNLEVLDARIASALNKIIHNSHFKRRISQEEQKAQKQDRFPSWKTDRLFDLRILPGHWSQRFYRKLCRPGSPFVFEMTIFRNSIRSGTEFYCP